MCTAKENESFEHQYKIYFEKCLHIKKDNPFNHPL